MNRPTRALVLTAGLATRLRPLSAARAKAALPVAGVPLAARILAWLGESGIRDAVLNLHHRPETIAREIGHGSGTGVRVRYSWEQPLLGSAGGPRKALPLLDADRFFIVNGDTLTDVSLEKVAETHARSGALVTMALIPNPRPDHYGGVLVRDGFVCGFTSARQKPEEPNYHFIGVQVAEATVFEDVPDDRPTESVGWLYKSLMAHRSDAIAAHVSDAGFEDIGTPADYLDTCLRIAATEKRPEVLVGAGSTIGSGVRLTRSVLWDRVTIGEGAELVECVAADDVEIPAGTKLERKAIVPGPDGSIAVDL